MHRANQRPRKSIPKALTQQELDLAVAQEQRQDAICHAATGLGKTFVAAAPYALNRNKDKVTIIVSPLIALQDEMVKTFEDEFGLPAVAVSSGHGGLRRDVLQTIVDSKYRIVLVSPELLTTRTFTSRVLKHPHFHKIIYSVIVDEVHCVSHWGDSFRKAYAEIGSIQCQLRLLVGVLRTSPRPWIYCDNIAEGSKIADYLRQRLPQEFARAGVIREYCAVFSTEYRNLAMKHFREGRIRIMVCTDAAGMGCNIPDIDVVVQWRLPQKLSAFVQRAGRAARARNRKGLAVLLCEPSAFSADLSELLNDALRKKGAKGRLNSKKATSEFQPNKAASKAYAAAHGRNRGACSEKDELEHLQDEPDVDVDAADEGLIHFVQTTGCCCALLAKVFRNPPSSSDLSVPCCDICHPSLLDQIRPGPKPSVQRGPKTKKCEPRADIVKAIHAWRVRVSQTFPRHSFLTPGSVLSEDGVTGLASMTPLSAETISTWLVPRWIRWEKYGEELTNVVLDADRGLRQTIAQPPSPSREHRLEANESQDRNPSTSRRGTVPTPRAPQPSSRAARRRSPSPPVARKRHRSTVATEEPPSSSTRLAHAHQPKTSALAHPPLPPPQSQTWQPPYVYAPHHQSESPSYTHPSTMGPSMAPHQTHPGHYTSWPGLANYPNLRYRTTMMQHPNPSYSWSTASTFVPYTPQVQSRHYQTPESGPISHTPVHHTPNPHNHSFSSVPVFMILGNGMGAQARFLEVHVRKPLRLDFPSQHRASEPRRSAASAADLGKMTCVTLIR
ncbi:P-loop containing nucleoside triphosphate hydrolase protein [Coniophora puteana RWD-64-598 SS2]|uniref:DNA 3'-5' helicase n=1 Tax=Coniophora puteana (strain RWD-64-598) TaxID=741705 RepID=A0A5M3MFA7_CONPW|nr:P-loop containing nucleoside triphosphate hydrolase protein [Coniophora puteana RWD-64-598 SS2]EIW77928.1 P-loop containing nucleoside triphosphate hydrolase protein [Coniophora puteana RWD-64-598 SS2]